MESIEICNYTDYRLYLKDYYIMMKNRNPNFSYTLLSEKAKIKSRGFLCNVINGKRNLTKQNVFGLIKAIKLNKFESEYFENLVSFNHAENIDEKNYYFEKLTAIKSKGKGAWKQQLIRNDQFEFYSKLYHSIIRSLIGMHTFTDDYEWLAKTIMPKVTVKQVKESVALLEKLGFIKRKDGDGPYELENRFIATPSQVKSLAVLNYHVEAAKHAVNCLREYPPSLRNVSSVMVGISQKGYNRICHEIEKFRDHIVSIVEEETDAANVYQLNLQLIPMSKINSNGGEE